MDGGGGEDDGRGEGSGGRDSGQNDEPDSQDERGDGRQVGEDGGEERESSGPLRGVGARGAGPGFRRCSSKTGNKECKMCIHVKKNMTRTANEKI